MIFLPPQAENDSSCHRSSGFIVKNCKETFPAFIRQYCFHIKANGYSSVSTGLSGNALSIAFSGKTVNICKVMGFNNTAASWLLSYPFRRSRREDQSISKAKKGDCYGKWNQRFQQCLSL